MSNAFTKSIQKQRKVTFQSTVKLKLKNLQ